MMNWFGIMCAVCTLTWDDFWLCFHGKMFSTKISVEKIIQ